MTTTDAPWVAVALHDVQPATFERCALIRDWLDDLGIDRVTLLVIPAPRLRPLSASSDLADWLRQRRARGDAIAQHGFSHYRADGRAEFPALGPRETREKLAAGRRLLALAGLEPRGFVAPGYASTPALRRELSASYDWWATLLRVRSLMGVGTGVCPVVGIDQRTRVRRGVSRCVVRIARRIPSDSLRLDLHPADFERPRHAMALEDLIGRARDHRAVTYDDLALAP